MCRYGRVGFQPDTLGGNAGLLDAGPPELGRRAAGLEATLFIILAVATVLVVGAAYFFSSDGTSGLVAPVIAVEISRWSHADTA